MSLTPPIEPDTKDWTWVLERACPECGFAAGDVPVGELPAALLENAAAWVTALAGPDVGTRPSSDLWKKILIQPSWPDHEPTSSKYPSPAGGAAA